MRSHTAPVNLKTVSHIFLWFVFMCAELSGGRVDWRELRHRGSLRRRSQNVNESPAGSRHVGGRPCHPERACGVQRLGDKVSSHGAKLPVMRTGGVSIDSGRVRRRCGGLRLAGWRVVMGRAGLRRVAMPTIRPSQLEARYSGVGPLGETPTGSLSEDA
ncbi:unnamed protein product [Gadus morhua 'NCC']